jgi:hypothetical protein
MFLDITDVAIHESQKEARMIPLTLNPRTIAETDFPFEGTPAEQWCFLLHYAVLAPSEYNSQPWYFKIRGPICELYADRSRQLTVVDPDRRELLISCGAAFLNLLVALRHFGYREELNLCLAGEHPDLLARVKIGRRESATDEEHLLFSAIQQRTTNLNTFEERSLPEDLLARFEELAGEDGVWLHYVGGREYEVISELVATGDRMLWKRTDFRSELAKWIRSSGENRDDGLLAAPHGKGNIAGTVSPFVVRTVNLDGEEVVRSQHLVASAPMLGILGTYSDTPPDWFATGQAIEKMLLLACASGVQSSFVNQPMEVPELREQVQMMVGPNLVPQLVVRMGYGPAVPPTPRRSVKDVLLEVEQKQNTAYNL